MQTLLWERLPASRHIAFFAGLVEWRNVGNPYEFAGTWAMSRSSNRELAARGMSVYDVLRQNDAYHALRTIGGLIFTGPASTNVNDVAVALVDS